MHDAIKKELALWYNYLKPHIDNQKVADLGSYDINGSVKDIIPHAIGFDILPGKNVDVVLVPGIIPPEHKNKYGFVTSTGSFQCCPDSRMFKAEILDLLNWGGELFLTMCSDGCKYKHSTSPNSYNFQDSVRMTSNQLASFFEPEMKTLISKTVGTDVFYWGKKR